MGDSVDSIHGMLRLNHSQSPRDIRAVSIKESIIYMYTYTCVYNIIYTCKWSHLFHAVHRLPILPSRSLPVGDAMIHCSRPGYFSRYIRLLTINEENKVAH